MMTNIIYILFMFMTSRTKDKIRYEFVPNKHLYYIVFTTRVIYVKYRLQSDRRMSCYKSKDV